MKRIVILLLCLFIVTLPLDAGRRKSTAKTSTTSTTRKTVHVKAYTKKNGTQVKAHTRSAPQSRKHK